MYLKKLDIVGFKSFANKTTIHFSSGITAIVGPNGCGKTNILDALRWVLGEQKVTLLRGSKMEEVIFNGTRDMKPLGMAEVTLTLVNNKGILPTEYTEVQITRRLFRSGESEYLLNKVPCRLKDISELFYDTGVGAHSYSVIQQDMIEAVISDKAEERRFLFEEAAGITKYKQRKRAALRKLEATESDFLRLNDIYAEVKTQVNSLRRQQKKAERYKEVQDSIRQWDLYLNSQRVRDSERDKRELMASLDRLADEASGKQTGIDGVSSQLEDDRRNQIDIEQELTRVGNQVYEMSEKAHQIEKEISIQTEKKANSALLIERNRNDIAALEKRAELLAEQRQETEALLQTQRQELTQLQAELTQAESDQAEADRLLLGARSAKEQENRQLIELEGKLSSGKTEEDNLRQQIDELTETIATIDKQLADNLTRREQLQTELSDQNRTVQEIESSKNARETESKQLAEQLEQLVTRGEELADESSNLTASIEACQARMNLLEDMMLQYEGYESGVKAAMDVAQRWPGIYGTVAEKFVPDEGLEIAVEAALGDMARFLICDSRTTGESIIAYLKTENKGRIGILVPDTGTLNPAVKRPELEMPEFVGWLDNLVNTDDKLRPLMQAVLSRTAVFKAGFKPDDILQRLPYGFQAVSTGGDVYSKNIISGGSDDRLPLFRRREKVQEQQNMIAELERQHQTVKDARSRHTVEIADIRARLSKLADDIASLSEDLDSARQVLSEAEYRQRTIDDERTRLERDKKNLHAKRDAIEHRQYSLGLDFGQLTDRRQNLQQSIAASAEMLSDYEKKASAALQKVSELQVKLVESRSRIEQSESKIRHLDELRDDITYTRTVKADEITAAETQIVTSTEDITRLETELKEVFTQRSEITAKQNTLRVSQGELLEKVTAKEKQLKLLRSEKEQADSERHKLEMRLSTIDAELNSISERILDEYQTDIRTVEASNPDENLAEPQARETLHDLKDRLRSFGAVNLLALEEYETTRQRKDFLEEQLKDLTTAKDDLTSTITKINQTARQLFSETFDQVRINFRNLFVELFTGGEADIFLKDPSDPLESDIEIIARPRGKKLLSITMMSGGERALTAISLLFSLYLVKPSPFCILDEIDAPLDDANCGRFLRIIKKFSEQTQFITITHNKITMEAAHNLYGVTMEQFGVSKIVAVKFAETEGEEMPSEIVVSDDNQLDDEDSEPSNGNSPHPEADEAPRSLDDIPQRVIERLGRPVGEPAESDDDND